MDGPPALDAEAAARVAAQARRFVDAADSGWWMPDFPNLDAGFDDAIGIVVGIVGFLVGAVVLLTIVFPLIALTIELVLLVIAFMAGLIGRLVFGRPWRIEAVTKGPPPDRREVQAHGLRESRQAAIDLAALIALGR